MNIGFLMDPLSQLLFKKDTTFAMLLAAQKRNHRNFVLLSEDVWLQDGIAWGRMQSITVVDDLNHPYTLGDVTDQPLVDLDLLLMRLDPPVNHNYIVITHLLELVEAQGLTVVNKPASLRDANEKLFTAWFPQCCPKTLVTSQSELIIEFVESVEKAVIKPLDSMGGQSVFQLSLDDPNHYSIIENITQRDTKKVMVQQFIPEIADGDKRILMIDGEPVPYALARVPAADDFRGNLAAGAAGVAKELTDRDRWICEQVGPVLRDKGLRFVGLDVIGDYLTEINVTSPTCARELDRLCELDIAGDFIDAIVADQDQS
ncbi:MAG: glutathione synthase [Gammaproteobacteria bacterium RIFCSPLOWO2_02_FULL_42_14]|nr:MAG: glutathione synthase [Gammaproteobacteria bacterium RIFCSPHIGHO2_02_FULL_42_43]OGT29087.1 MAG: glutathione synthase [Gammaproteobacteria bacterium RIFCSPHIGHO2_01_FULL_42_8]OGT52748.1 MAG: glutathione synthase [Gammaproteobacteria bacterium RIFCSPHIGHO2_12_FULL_41_25]OGT63290.1 MAG: glutathione synthase [Gammaproteobacteria bacterium RIFCSPLOWO2_02_FULL_42_14]OGT86878.1 MAG: glutathione synthase [Gammaproteobacteria bacterium RIFCSPLOWO2_12_FULL_42_18]